MKKQQLPLLILAALLMLGAVACTAQPATVEVTRVVNVEVPVEVTRVVAEQIVQAVEVEVTRVVEVVITEAPPEATAVPAAEEPTATPEPTAVPDGPTTYVVQPGDSFYGIAQTAGISLAALWAANGMDATSNLIAGRELIIPAPGEEFVAAAPETAAEEPAPTAEAAPAEEPAPAAPVVVAAAGGNLLPNPSFEEGWHFYLYNELQVPDGWQLATDEGPNNLEGGSGGLFNRPEVRVVPSSDLPPAEHNTFILDGNKTVKAFKGSAPTAFSMFTDIALQPGTYRFTMRFVPDTVIGYDNRTKVYSSDPQDAQARIIAGDGGTGWQGTSAGTANTITYDFTLEQAQTIRLGGAFRNRSIMVNNGWFLDGWSLAKLE